MTTHRNPYEILGVSRTASSKEIRSAYRKLARKYHPDGNGKVDEEKFKSISSAYEILSKPEKRKLYDEFGDIALQQGFDPELARTMRDRQRTPRQGPSVRFRRGPFGFDPGDLFGHFGGTAEDLFPGSSMGRPAAPRGMVATVQLGFVEALRGTQVRLRIPVETACAPCLGTGRVPSDRRSPCARCGGQGLTSTEKDMNVRIPPGTDDGTELRVPAPGGTGGMPSGNVVIRTRVRPHPWFRRHGLDLHLTLPVTLDEAYRGATIEVPGPDGPLKMKVPPCSSSGRRLRLRGQGVRRKGKRGDLYVKIQVRMPDRPDDRLGQAIRESSHLYDEPVRKGVKL